MPVPHFNIKITQRSKGNSAVAGAAYQAGEKLFSEYDQKTKNYTCKKEVVYTEIMLPPNAPPEYADRATLWNSVEEIEKQWNSQLARRFVAALPREVPMELLPQMVKEYCEEQFVSKGMCCDFAIHDPDPPGHNPHCHFIHILEDEAASRAFIDMMWAEVMFIYQNFPVKLTLSKDMDKELKELQKQFMPEDTKAGLIQSFLDNFKGTQVCSKLIYAEALNHPFDEPKQWEIREINEIMNNSIEGWRPFSNPRSFAKYGRQRGWERIPPPDNEPSATGSNLTDGFRELTEEEARQMELPF